MFLLRSKERTPILLSGGENYYHYTYCLIVQRNEKCIKYWIVFSENPFNLIFINQWNSKHISLHTNTLRLCKMICDLTNLHAVHVIMWRCLSNTVPVIRTVLKNLFLLFYRPKTVNYLFGATEIKMGDIYSRQFCKK